MPRVLMPGNVVRGYRIEQCLRHGAFAISYRSVLSDGTKAFLKQYKLPTPRTPWYRGYMDHQATLKRFIEASGAKRFCYRMLEYFEEKVGTPCYFQAFEFIEHGEDLQGLLEGEPGRRETIDWTRRLVFAKVFMAGMASLHEAGIIHCDLKPENIVLIPTPEIEVGYTLRFADMDWSLLASRKPPWSGDPDMASVGTPGYQSPEHLRGELPVKASDVFTCGLILHELLADGHPYRCEDPDGYRRKALAYRAATPKLRGHAPPPATDEGIASTLHACLDPDPRNRPTALAVHHALTGLAPKASPTPIPKAPPPSPKPPAGCVVLEAPNGKHIEFRIDGNLGQARVKSIGCDGAAWSAQQFRLVKAGAGWAVEPVAGTTNDTLLNGRRLTSRTALKSGDVLAVGNATTKTALTPFKVRLE
jgi:eukaryotic-like serine/threonine-protein kinase